MAISTASAKAKGRIFQQKVRDAFLRLHPTLTLDDVRSCPMGSGGADLQLSAEAKRLIPFDIECKKRAKIALLYEALIQARRDNLRAPLAVVEADRKRPLAVMYLDDFMALLASKT